jgi:hypothetical protein
VLLLLLVLLGRFVVQVVEVVDDLEELLVVPAGRAQEDVVQVELGGLVVVEEVLRGGEELVLRALEVLVADCRVTRGEGRDGV